MLKVSELEKYYKNHHVIKGIDYVFKEGGIYSLIGPNGSGKTTFLHCLAGVINASAGTIALNGLETRKRECKRNIGYAPDMDTIYPNISLEALLRFADDVKNGGMNREQIEMMMKGFELYGLRNKKFLECSCGMKKKTEMILSFTGFPKLILLDEPTNGMDTAGVIYTKKLIQEAKKKGCIVIVTSHILDFVQDICDHNLFLSDGKIKFETDSTDTLEKIYEELYLGHG